MCIDLYVDKLLVYSNCLTPSPSPVPSPMHVDNIFIPVTNTSPTPGNYSIPYDTPFTPLPDHTLIIALIMAGVIIPCVVWMICACRKKKKVQPENRKKKCCEKKKVQPVKRKKKCCEKKSPLPTEQVRGTQTN